MRRERAKGDEFCELKAKEGTLEVSGANSTLRTKLLNS